MIKSSAELFQEIAGEYLASLGFSVFQGPSDFEFSGANRGSSDITYRHPRGVYLRGGFDLMDSKTARLDFGRRWNFKPDPSQGVLSGSYASFGRRLDIDVPEVFELAETDDEAAVCERIKSSLEDSLEYVLAGTDLQLILEVEESELKVGHLKHSSYSPEETCWDT